MLDLNSKASLRLIVVKSSPGAMYEVIDFLGTICEEMARSGKKVKEWEEVADSVHKVAARVFLRT